MSDEDDQKVWANPDLIQIKAENEEEVQRRIEAFITNKRNEVDERNIREFINPFSSEPGGGCARTEAVYLHREGEKSHISLKQVENTHGPQTLLVDEDACSALTRLPVSRERAEAVEERLANMEAHLNMEKGSHEIFMRLKLLEKRISYLEGLSPEYFANRIPSSTESCNSTKTDVGQVDKAGKNLTQVHSLSDVQSKIMDLKKALREKLSQPPN